MRDDLQKPKTEYLEELRALRQHVRELEKMVAAGGNADLASDLSIYREQAEETSEDSERSPRAWLDHSPVCTKIVDPDFNLKFMSRAGIEALQIKDISSFYGKPYPFDFYPKPFTDLMVANLKKAKETGEVHTQESAVYDLEGNELWFHSTIVPVFDSNDQMEYGIVVSIDTTAGNQANEALRESERDYRSLAESVQDCITRYDKQCRHLYQNAAGYRLSGFTEEEFIGKTYRELGLDDKLCSLSEEHILRVFETGEPSDAVFEWKNEDGPRIYDWHVYPEFGPDRSVRSVLGISYDVTDRKRAEERKQVERQMQQRQKLESLGVMAGGIAHDFNNILAAVLGNAEVALSQLAPEASGRRNLQEIRIAARRAAGLTDQMLAYSGKGALAIEDVDVSQLVSEMAQLLEISHTKKTAVRYQFRDDLPAIEGDVSQLRQVVMNLVTNASEAVGDEGGVITVSTGVIESTADHLAGTYVDDELAAGSYVYLEVADTGCGMDEEAQRRIFEPFFTTKFTGRGLGMAAVLGIVRAHKGAIDIQSEVGRGAKLTVLFPARGELAKATAKSVRRDERWTGSGTVLVVDDESQIRTVTRSLLEERGFAVLLAKDGIEAIEVFREHSDEIVCVLLDLTMHRMGGEEAFVALRRIRADVPILLVSGYGEAQLKQRLEGLDFAGFLKKPVQASELLEKVRVASQRGH